jgi:anti-sigma B factor antagonist
MRGRSTIDADFSTSLSGGAESILLRVSGRLTIDSSPVLRSDLLQVLSGRPLKELTIDLAGVSYLDTSGIATLVEALKVACRKDTVLRLQNLAERPRYLLEVTGMLHLFETVASQESSNSKAK